MSLGQNIKRLRMAAGISTQRGLADRLHVPQPQVSDWENDRYGTLETQTLMKLAKVLRCTIDQLLDGLDPDYDRVREARVAIDAEPRHIDYATDADGSIPLVAEGSAALAELFLVILGFVMMATRRETPKWWWKKGPKDGADQPIPSGKPTTSY